MNNKEAFSLYTEHTKDLSEKTKKSLKFDYASKQFCDKFDLGEVNYNKFRCKFKRLIENKPRINDFFVERYNEGCIDKVERFMVADPAFFKHALIG